jgi:amidohydrolase
VLLFQPAEERISGARAMIEGGLLESVRADRLIGCHVLSVFPAGTVCLRPGIALAGGQGLRFDLRGSGGHGAFPGRPGNVVTAVGELLHGLPSVVDGLEHEGTSCACSAGVVQAGTALNVLPVSAIVEGTLRTFSEAQKAEALSRLRALCGRITEQTGVEIAIGASPFHAPPVVNDAAASALVRAASERALGSERVLTGPPFPASDDVSEFLRRVPGCYFFVGAARSDGTSGMHHSPTFAIDEEALRTGMIVMAEGAVAMAEE